jgi:hypothetical protein
LEVAAAPGLLRKLGLKRKWIVNILKQNGEWSLPNNMEFYNSMEEEAFPQMEKILEKYGLEITLKILIDALGALLNKRGNPDYGLTALDDLKKTYVTYCLRYDGEDEEDDLL